MSASLVGSEMCIRDRGGFCAMFRADAESADETGRRARRRRFSGGSEGAAVSYTHLTLPTICSV
eukprot:12849795-Alexandrium_andersonii.AAC.1